MSNKLADEQMKYKTLNDDEVLDTKTELVWKRNHEPNIHTLKKAKKLEHGIWRLPTVQELLSIVDYSKYAPATDTEIFTDAPSADFWSSSPDASYSSFAWYVYFHSGRPNTTNRGYHCHIRLVTTLKEYQKERNKHD
jgi:hypothetical protein